MVGLSFVFDNPPKRLKTQNKKKSRIIILVPGTGYKVIHVNKKLKIAPPIYIFKYIYVLVYMHHRDETL